MPLPSYLKRGGKEPSNTIAGLSDIRRWERIGRVRLGLKLQRIDGKNEDGSPRVKTRPKEVPVFLCPPELVRVFGEPTEKATIHSHATGQPLSVPEWYKTNKLPPPGPAVVTRLKIVLPGDPEASVAETLPKVIPQNLKRYGSSFGLKCFGDGFVAHERRKDGTWGEIPCPEGCADKKLSCDPNPAGCSYAETGECKANGDLLFLTMDPRKKDYARALSLGCYQLNTKSRENIVHMNSYLDRIVATFMQEFRGRRSFTWVPLWLIREEREIQHPKFGRQRHFYVRLEIDREFMDTLAESRARALPIPKEKLALVAPVPVDDGPDEAPGGETVAEPEGATDPSWTMEDGSDGQGVPKGPEGGRKAPEPEAKPKEGPKEAKKGPEDAKTAPKPKETTSGATEATQKPPEATIGGSGGDLFEGDKAPEGAGMVDSEVQAERDYIAVRERLRDLLERTGAKKDAEIYKSCLSALDRIKGFAAKKAEAEKYLAANRVRLGA